MEKAEAITFFGKWLLVWFPGEDEPLYDRLEPGVKKKFESCFEEINFSPKQKKLYDPNSKKRISTLKKKFYKWNSKLMPQ